ncbi:MAG: hypothetical protein E7055_17190 [Lentisphaerae bacterium]|nr:hypothetical protein [Lentisphaerota bacterium]
MKIKWMALTALTIAAGSVSAAVKAEYLELKDDDAARKAYLAQPVRIWGDKNYKVGADKYNALLVLSNSKITYAFHLYGTMKDGVATKVNIGMLRPSIYNWYAGGFISISSGKEKLSAGNFTLKEVKGTDDSGWAEFEFSGGALNGKLRFELPDNDDKLLVTFTPAGQFRYMANLVSYPGHYGDAKLRARKMISNVGEVEGNVKKLTPQDCWFVFADSYYDREQNRGDGCCAFLFNPKDVLPGSVVRSGYACQAYLYCRPGQTLTLIVWDFKRWSMKQAVDYMKKLDVKFE